MRLFELTEGRHDPHTHKAIFMLGGPGSGKTHVAKILTGGTGLRSVNVDEFYEMLRDKQGIQGRGFDDELYKFSGNLTQKKLDLLLKGRVGILVDGTGRKVQRLAQMKDELESLGYDTMAVFVNTDINTALDRNEERRRKADNAWVRKVHADLQQKLGELQSMFGQNMLIVDNSEDRKDFADAQKAVDKFLNAPNKRPMTWPVKEAFKDEQEEADVYKTVAQSLMRRAKDYISEVGEPMPLLYRGYEKYSEEPFHRPYRDNREPKDSGLFHQDLYDAGIEAAGGIAKRTNSIFVTGDRSHAKPYGEVYVVFPMGKFNYTYHSRIKDWYETFGPTLEGIAPVYFEEFEDILRKSNDPIATAKELIDRSENVEPDVNDTGKRISQITASLAKIFLSIAEYTIVDTGLAQSLNYDVEVLLSAPGGYYYIPEHHFFKYVKPYLEINGLRVEDQQPAEF